MNTQSKRIDLVAAFALALGVFAATPVLAKDGSPTLGGEKNAAASVNVFSGSEAATRDFTPSTNRYGKR
jgi:xanthine dehydrogenase iron-sulfur cluster and FAD-binding subunit A